MFDWNDMRHFIALAEAGTLAGAARKLHVDHATVARRVAALEHALGEALVDRFARPWRLTESGRDVARVAEGMLAQAHALERAVRSRKTGALARITVSAPPAFASIFLAPHVVQFASRHPEIQLTLLGNQPLLSLSRQESDIVVRLSQPTEPSYVSRRIGSMAYGLYAAHDYINRPPSEWQFIAYHATLDHVPEQVWLLGFADGRHVAFRSNDLTTQLAAVHEKLGIAALPDFLVRADKSVIALPADGGKLWRDIHLVVHADLRRVPAVRIVLDFIAKSVANHFGNGERHAE